MSDFSKYAKQLYDNGLSCSEAVVMAAYENKLFETENINEIHKIASMFSKGVSSGCICGAVAGAEIAIGCIFGRNISERTALNRKVAAEFISTFKEKRKATCCNALSAPYKNDPIARRNNCSNLVEESAEILEQLIEKHSKVEAIL